GRVASAPRHATRGDRARLLRRLHPVGACRTTRRTARYDQEPDVRRARPTPRALGRHRKPRGTMEPGIHELTAGYALDALDPEERGADEEHPEGCDPGREDLPRSWDVSPSLALAAPGPAPSPELRERILTAARAEPQNVVPIQRKPRLTGGWALGAVAAAA